MSKHILKAYAVIGAQARQQQCCETHILLMFVIVCRQQKVKEMHCMVMCGQNISSAVEVVVV